MLQIEPGYQPILEKLGLDTLRGVLSYAGHRIKEQRGRRDVVRVDARHPDGRPVTFFVKRMWKSYKKDGIRSLLTRGHVRSKARIEFENLCRIRRAGFDVSPPVAFGEDCGWFRERSSFIITEVVEGVPLDEWLENCGNLGRRREVLAAVGRMVRRMHDSGIGFPDLFARHIFVAESPGQAPAFKLIDIARANITWWRSSGFQRARDLAALNAGTDLGRVGITDRLRVIRAYARNDRELRRLVRGVAARMSVLLTREKFADFHGRAAPASGA